MAGMEQRPVFTMLRNASGRISGHMPGHKGMMPFDSGDLYSLDTTEIPQTDDLYVAEGGLRDAMVLYAHAAGAARTLFLHNGSTSGIHVMLQLYAREGETVLLPRNAHLSAVNACVLGGMKPAWMNVRCTPDGYAFVNPTDAAEALRTHPQAKAMLLVRPDYYGGAMEDDAFAALVRQAHAQGTRVVVDEAHGAHFPWSGAMTSAGDLGADAWVQSVHKTLMGLTGSAVLHLANDCDERRAWLLLRREQTSSPSFLLMMSIDDSRAWMALHGRKRLQETADALHELRSQLIETPYDDAHEKWQRLPVRFDPTRLAVTAPQGGRRLAEQLRQEGIDAEMADDRRVVMIFTAMDDAQTIAHVSDVLKKLPVEQRLTFRTSPLMLHLPHGVLTPRQAAMASDAPVPLSMAEGRISAVAAGLYPPGIPLVMPGELVTGEITAQLRSAGARERFGVEGDCLRCVNV